MGEPITQSDQKAKFTELLQQAYDAQALPTFVITHNTQDYGELYVVRLQKVINGSVVITPEHATTTTLDDARALIPDDLVCFERAPHDDPVIVESWI